MGDTDEGGVIIRFILPKGKTEATCSEDLALTFETSTENGLSPVWIAHDEVLKMNPVKTDVFVIDPFDGEAFQYVSRFKCTVVGPRCLLTCIQKGEPVPALPYPLYSAAMKGLIVTSTGFSVEKKKELKEKVEWMAGIYSNVFHEGVTHLVAEVVRSKKYDVAVKKDTPVMTVDWVSQVWERGKHENIHATDPPFARYRCPALYGLNITVSQMHKRDRDLLKRSIESHGGGYSGAMSMNSTSILIITKPEGEKYMYARKWGIPIVNSDWVFDSIEKGFCLPTESYRLELQIAGNSTPTKEGVPRHLDEASMCSTIMMPNDTLTNNVNETINSSNLTLMSHSNRDAPNMERMLESLNLNRVRKAGPFLDECKLFLSGFSESEIEFLDKVINSACGQRMNQLTPSVTHLVGKKVVAEHHSVLNDLGLTPYKVGLQWVVESMLMGRPVDESDFPIPAEESRASLAPIAKATLGLDETQRSFEPNPTKAVKKLSLDEEQAMYEDDLLAQYKVKSPTAEKDKEVFVRPADVTQSKPAEALNDASMSSTQQNTCTPMAPFLQGKKLHLAGFDSEIESDLTEWIHEVGGEIVNGNYPHIIDYLMVPIQNTTSNIKAKETVTNNWIEDCIDQSRLLPVEYFHRPFTTSKLKSCEGIVIGITNYTTYERQFISDLAKSLGMLSQEIFAKRDKLDSKKSTHLVCSDPEGSKYDAAIKWKIPVVSKDWILACLQDQTWVSEKPFLVGACQAFTPGKPLPKNPKSVSLLDDDEEEEVTFSSRVQVVQETQNITHDTLSTNAKPVEALTPCSYRSRMASTTSASTTSAAACKTPTNATTLPTVALDTPGMDIDMEKLRPRPLDLSGFDTPPKPYYADSQPSPSMEKKPDKEDDLPWYLNGMKTPDTPWGCQIAGPNPSPRTRKFYKHQYLEQKHFQMTEKERKAYEEDQEWRRKRRLEDANAASAPAPARPLTEYAYTSKQKDQLKETHEKFLDEMERRGMVVLERDSRSFEEIMEEKLNKIGKSWKNPSKRIRLEKESVVEKKVLEGVVIYVTKKLSNVQYELHGIIDKLGGEFRQVYRPEVTHVIFTGKPNDSNEEFRTARRENKKIVSPSWLHMCRDENSWISEDTFTHDFIPNCNRLDAVWTDQTKNKQRKTRKTETTKTSGQLQDETKGSTKSRDSIESKIDLTADLQKLDMLVERSKMVDTTIPRPAMRITLTSTDVTPERMGIGKTDIDIFSSKTQSEPSESQIQWIDPKEEMERVKLAAKLAAETQALKFETRSAETFDSMEIPDNLTEAMVAMDDEDAHNKENDSPKKQNIKFMVSGLGDEERINFFKFLENLQVPFVDGSTCDENATHVIAVKLSRSEKVLGSIASGKWILHPEYLETCLKQKRLISEMEYEWGNPANKFYKTLNTPLEQKLAEASFRWRTIIQKNPQRGVFEGIKAIIHTSEQRKEAFKRLLKAGKGTVVRAMAPYRDTLGATHCIAEPSKAPNLKIDYVSLAAKNVAVVGPFYINEFLISDPPPKVEQHLIEDFKPFWDKRKLNL